MAFWQSGRIEAMAVAPGDPDLESQERRDRVATGTYRALAESGALTVAEGLQVQPPGQLWDSIREAWGIPVNLICDRFRLAELQDAVKAACPIEPRVSQWSESSFDIRSLRAGAKDGPFGIAEGSRPLLAAALAVAMVVNDTSGNTRLIKKGSNNQARDDAAAALVLASGAFARAEMTPVGGGDRHVVIPNG